MQSPAALRVAIGRFRRGDKTVLSAQHSKQQNIHMYDGAHIMPVFRGGHR